VNLVWVGKAVVLAVHDEQLHEHGGASGLRDEGALDSALHRPIDLAAYRQPDIFDLAAAYAFGLARNHPFTDGNKRTSLVVTELFLDLNGWELAADDLRCLVQWLGLSSGEIDQDEMAAWLRQNSARR
jgi:death-on-curing protein